MPNRMMKKYQPYDVHVLPPMHWQY